MRCCIAYILQICWHFLLIKRVFNYIGGRIVVRVGGGGGGGGGARSHWPGLLSCVSVRLISWAPLQPLLSPSRHAGLAVWPQSSLPPSSSPPHSVSPAPSVQPDNIKSADSAQHTATTDWAQSLQDRKCRHLGRFRFLSGIISTFFYPTTSAVQCCVQGKV